MNQCNIELDWKFTLSLTHRGQVSDKSYADYAGQYKISTADCGLRTMDCGLGKIWTRYKRRTGKYDLGLKHGLGIKRGLRTADWV